MKLDIVRRPAAENPERLGSELHPVLRRVYAGRGLRDSQELELTLERLLPVGTLAGVDAAAQLLARHREGSRVLVVGDFDADGATSTALVVRALRAFGFGDVEFLVPNRFEYGYGLTPEIVELAAARAPGLLVTVDNGISSNAGVAAARARGIEVLVTDHHLPGAELPAANVIVNPNLPDSRFPSRALAGVGVAFYVLAALGRQLEAEGLMPAGAPRLARFLDLVALGTVADVVPLDANNRILVAQGLARIRAGLAVPGIRALLEIAGRDAATLTAGDLGFAVAPRLNAAGRLADMALGIRCLLTDDDAEARALATELDQLNSERRGIEARMQAQALAAVRVLRDPGSAERRAGICLFDPAWHQGVVGLVASRVKEQLRRPVVAFAAVDAGMLRGSARSIPGVHIRDVFDAMAAADPSLIQKFGGHAMAAGLSLEQARLDDFARAFDAEVARWLARSGKPDVVETDGELTAVEIALTTAQALRAGGPWGAGFPEPLFDGVFEVQNCRIVGERHLKLVVAAPEGRGGFDAIAFNVIDPGAPGALPSGKVRLVYRLDANQYQGESRLQLVVDHLLPA